MNTTTTSTARGFTGWSVPMLITQENKTWMGLTLAFVATVLYMTSNHIHLFPPQLLPMTALDQAIPFVPGTVWIYTSEYYLFLTVYLLCKDIENLNRYAYSFLTLQSLSVLIFWIWPTTFPRDQFPLPADLDALTFKLFSSLRAADTPASCCPSLHVSSVYLSSFMFLREQRGKFPFFFVWATSIALTTLTTKQHYIIDVVTGFLMAVIVYGFFNTFVSLRPGSGAARRFLQGLQAKR
ncbi:MAG: phosphatase PAP2 family protein [Oligoflexia bacterium]|nr:phosphatase PAP2 family protein [Oligoflexia bacterium]